MRSQTIKQVVVRRKNTNIGRRTNTQSWEKITSTRRESDTIVSLCTNTWGPITGTSREDRGRNTGRGQTKKRNHRKRKKREQKKEESYGGGKQTTANGWLCCRYPESRQEDWSGLPPQSVEGWDRNYLLSILFSQVKRKPEQAQAPSEKIPKLDFGQVSLLSMLSDLALVNHCSFAPNSTCVQQVWFGESSQSAARWEQRAGEGNIGQELPPPPLTRRLTPMSELLNSLLEAENSSPAQDMRSSEATIAEETSPPTLKRNLTPMSNLLESLLKVVQ